MPVTVVAGAQFGSEGKGKVALFLAQHQQATIVIRVGGSNSGHTAYGSDGRRHVFRHLPTAALLQDTLCVLGPGSYIDAEVLRQDMERIDFSPDRLAIDPHAMVITDEHKSKERSANLRARIGSTASGTGAAVMDRVSRSNAVHWVSDDPYAARFVRPTRPMIRAALDRGERVLIEGTQGFGLSNLLSRHYPFVTSRDTTAAAFVAEAGLSPVDVDNIVLVARAFPIRVSGNSGPLPFETDWRTIGGNCGRPHLSELSSVTKWVRRVARFDPAIVKEAIDANAATHLVLNHVDYFRQTVAASTLPSSWEVTVASFEASIGRTFNWIGTSPSQLVSRSDIQNSICSDAQQPQENGRTRHQKRTYLESP